MSKKRRIIIFAAIAVLAVGLILASTIFRVRRQNVQFNQEIEGVSAESIVNAGEIKNGKSIFLVNKNLAKEKIEKAVPYAKIEKIYITFPNTVNFVVSKRVEFCYFEKDDNFIICDNSLKILRTSTEKPDLIKIDAKINDYQVGEFIPNAQIAGMFEAFSESITIEIDGSQSPEITLSNAKALESIKQITFDEINQVFRVESSEGFFVEYDIKGAAQEKHYYLMGILVNNNSSILTNVERASGKTFVLEKTSSGMRKYTKD